MQGRARASNPTCRRGAETESRVEVYKAVCTGHEASCVPWGPQRATADSEEQMFSEEKCFCLLDRPDEVPYFSDYKMHFFPPNLGGRWGLSYSLNVAYIYTGEILLLIFYHTFCFNFFFLLSSKT